MSKPIFPTPDWTGGNLTAFRRDYVRDLVDATTVPTTYYSSYNRAMKAQFFLDTQINAMKSRIESDFSEELSATYQAKYDERTEFGDLATEADARANVTLLDVTMRLVRAGCRELMLTDAGFVGSIADEAHRKTLFEVWAVEIKRDRTFAKARAGSYSMIRMDR